jgi:diguanylate cyclase (GGDEF)-like protein
MIEPTKSKSLHDLTDIVSDLKSSQQYEHVFHLIIEKIKKLFHCQTCAIVLIDLKTEYLRIENSSGLSFTFLKEFRKTMTTGEIGKLLWTGIPILITDSDLDKQRANDVKLEKSYKSCAVLPISVDQRSRGYLYVDSTHTEHFVDEDIPLLQMFADIAGLALHKYRLQEKIMRLERVESLTGLETYASFIEKLHESYDRAKTFGEHLALVIFDIDNFKYVVNTFGSETADTLLKEISDVIRSKIRNVDIACRYGVDEFIILSSNTSLEDAIVFAGGLRKHIDDNVFTDKQIDSSISVGLSVYPVNGSTIEELLQTGKHALFEAQRAGRNTVMYYRSPWYAGEPVTFKF